MRILYGVQGTGNGHITRSRLVVRALAERGAEVDILVSGREADTVPVFDGARSVIHRTGLSFVVDNGRILKGRTLRQLNLAQLASDIRSLDVRAYDRIVTDYEPVTAWAARLQKRRVIGIGHQYAFVGDTPMAQSDFPSKLVLRQFAPASVGLGLHWHPYAQTVLPPVVDVAALRRREPTGNVIVYLPWESQQRVTDTLQRLPDVQFHQYCKAPETRQEGNVRICPIDYTSFKDDLCAASGVLCNAGFELVSEALYLGVPVCVRPLSGQLEQQSNALALKRTKLAQVIDKLTDDSIRSWLVTARGSARQPYPDVAKAIADWLVTDVSVDPSVLARALWAPLISETQSNDVLAEFA